MADLNVLFVGLGSIGIRHLKNLHEECKNRSISLAVTALRSSRRALPPQTEALVGRQVLELPEGERFDLAFITSPTHLHASYLALLHGRVGAFFIEKPMFSSVGHDLEALGLGFDQRAYVAAPLRWTALYAALREKLQSIAPYSVRAICSSYLPGWRPGADYRKVYSASREMGGGVTLDLIHEWDYLCELFGLPQVCYCLRGKFSGLEIDSDDLSVYIARYERFLCEVHLDYFGKEFRRTAEFFCESGTLTADFGAGLLHPPNGQTESYAEATNDKFQREMAYFLDYALAAPGSGPAESLNSPHHALEVLRLALSIN